MITLLRNSIPCFSCLEVVQQLFLLSRKSQSLRALSLCCHKHFLDATVSPSFTVNNIFWLEMLTDWQTNLMLWEQLLFKRQLTLSFQWACWPFTQERAVSHHSLSTDWQHEENCTRVCVCRNETHTERERRVGSVKRSCRILYILGCSLKMDWHVQRLRWHISPFKSIAYPF